MVVGGFSFQAAIGEGSDCIEAAEIHRVELHYSDHQQKGFLFPSGLLLDGYVSEHLLVSPVYRNLHNKKGSVFPKCFAGDVEWTSSQDFVLIKVKRVFW